MKVLLFALAISLIGLISIAQTDTTNQTNDLKIFYAYPQLSPKKY